MTGRRLCTLAAGIAALVGTLAFSASAAQAYDNAPCFSRGEWRVFYRTSYPVYRCPLWTNHVPVYADPDTYSAVMGQLAVGGTANWFWCQRPSWRGVRGNFYLGKFVNNNWALTRADNGIVGWVPEVYFSGGGNWEADRGLPTGGACG